MLFLSVKKFKILHCRDGSEVHPRGYRKLTSTTYDSIDGRKNVIFTNSETCPPQVLFEGGTCRSSIRLVMCTWENYTLFRLSWLTTLYFGWKSSCWMGRRYSRVTKSRLSHVAMHSGLRVRNLRYSPQYFSANSRVHNGSQHVVLLFPHSFSVPSSTSLSGIRLMQYAVIDKFHKY